MTVLTPIITFPLGGQNVPVSENNVFTWNSTNQYSFYIEWQINNSSSTIYNTGWITSSTGSYTFSPNVFINTLSYKWRVKIRNSSGLESAFSEYAIFTGGNPVSLSIIYPLDEYDQITSLPQYQFSFNPESDASQYSYRIQVYIGATFDDWDSMSANEQDTLTSDAVELYDAVTTLVWDSGVVVSSATSVEQPSGYFIPTEYWYKVRVSITDSNGTTYISDLRSFYILLDDVPQTPEIIATNDNTNGRNTITITNPTPESGQVSASYNKLYRKKLDGTWELLVDNITTSTTYDTTCRSSKLEEYAVAAVGTNLIEGGKSTSATATCELESYWFTNLTTNETIELLLEPEWGQMQSERSREEYQPMDEIYPTVCYSPQRFYRGNFQATILEPTTTTWSDYCKTFTDVLDVGNSILMRSPFGDLFELDIYNLKISPFIRTDQARNISFDMVEVAEMVPAGTYTYSTPTSVGYWVVDPITNLGFQLYAEAEWDGMTSERDRYEGIGLSSEFASINYGNKKAIRSGFNGVILEPDTGTLAEEVMKLRELIDPLNKKPVEFLTPSGDKFLVDTYGFTYELFDRSSQARKISFEFIEVGVVT